MTAKKKENQIIEFLALLNPGRLGRLNFRQLLLAATKFTRLESDICKKRPILGRRSYRISVLATHSVQHFISILKLHLYSDGIIPKFTVSNFDGVITDGLDTSSPIWNSSPEAFLILPALDEIQSWPQLFADKKEIQDWVMLNAKSYIDHISR